MSPEKKTCPVCRALISAEKLETHLQKVHEQKMGESSVRDRPNPSKNMTAVLVAALLITVSIMGYIYLRRDNTGGMDNVNKPYAAIIVQGPVDGLRDGATIVVALEPNRAPVTVENFIKYANDGFFNGLIFHRVMEDFMIQSGGFEPGMTERTPTYPAIVNEASLSKMQNSRGTIAMARTDAPDSATSQFYINHADNNFLDWNQASDGHGYCAFGNVIQGMDVVDIIAGVPTGFVAGNDDVPLQDILIVSVTITYR